MQREWAQRALKAVTGASAGDSHVCIDFRVANVEGQYGTRQPGAYIPPWGSGDRALSLKASFNHALSQPGADTLLVAGHTDCGAVRALFGALHRGQTSDMASLMQPTSAEAADALRQGEVAASDESQVLRLLEQASLLQSVRHLMEYPLAQGPVREQVEAGKLQVVAAIRDVFGDYPAAWQSYQLFEPESGRFIPAGEVAAWLQREAPEIYDGLKLEGASSSIASGVPATEAAAQESFVVHHGHSETVATLAPEQVTAALRHLADQIGAYAQQGAANVR